MIFSSFATEALRSAGTVDKPAPEFLDRILVPVDFSDCSNNAIRFAIALAVRANSEVRLLHCVNMPLRSADLLVDPLDELSSEASRRLTETALEISAWLEKEGFPDLGISHVVKTGFTGELITDTAESWEADLIVMGTQGAEKIEGLLLGSNATHAIANANCPVLAVPDDAVFGGLKQIVLGTDLEEYDKKAIGQIVEIARLFEATLDLLHIIEPGAHFSPSKLNDYKAALLNDHPYENLTFHLYESKDNTVTEAIEEYAKSSKADLVAMMTFDRGFFARLFNPSVTKRLTLHAHTPVLAIHAKKD